MARENLVHQLGGDFRIKRSLWSGLVSGKNELGPPLGSEESLEESE